MFHPALWKLLMLQWRGRFRQFRRSLRTYRGLFQLAFIVTMLGYGLFSMFLVQSFGTQHASVAETLGTSLGEALSMGLFLFTGYSLLFSTGDAGVYFTPSEVAFLFPAPITRRQLLAFKLLQSLFGMAAISLMFTCMTTSQAGMAPARFLSVFLTIWFISLLTLNVAFVRQVLQKKIHALIRRSLAVFIGLLILGAANQAASAPVADIRGYLRAFQESTIGASLLCPFQIFARANQATDWAAFVLPAAIVLLVDLGLLSVAFRLDALSLEAALAASEKMSARLKLMQTRGVWQAFGTITSIVARRRLPQPPFWAGVGPVAWQRMTTMLRSSTKLLWLLGAAVIGTFWLVFMMGSGPAGTEIAPITGIIAMGYLTFFIGLSIQNDIDHVGYLKSLPLRSTAIIVGELVGIPVLLSVVQSLFLLAEACFFASFAEWLVGGMLLTLPFNLLVFGIDKLVFYVYPTRMVKGAPGDFQSAGKQMIFMTLKMLMLGVAAVIVGVIALPVALILQSPVATIAALGLALLIECIALVPLLTIAFDRFDPSGSQVS